MIRGARYELDAASSPAGRKAAAAAAERILTAAGLPAALALGARRWIERSARGARSRGPERDSLTLVLLLSARTLRAELSLGAGAGAGRRTGGESGISATFAIRARRGA